MVVLVHVEALLGTLLVTKSILVVVFAQPKTMESQSFPMPLNHYYGAGLLHKAIANQRQCCELPSLTVATSVTQFDHNIKYKPQAGVSHIVSPPVVDLST